MRIPLTAVALPPSCQRVTRKARGVHQRPHVLVVNGYPDGRDMYVDYLRFYGFSVTGVSDPSQALRCIQVLVPDVIVTDFVFPTGDLDGPGFIARVRGAVLGQHPHVIVVSGFTQRQDEQRARKAGADRFLLKPCLPWELARRIEQTWTRAGARSHAQ